MTDELPWFHNSPVPIDLVRFTTTCLNKNKNLNSRILARIRSAFANKKHHEHDRPKQLGKKWQEGVYVEDKRFQLHCTEKDGLVLITSMSYDKRAFRRAKGG